MDSKEEMTLSQKIVTDAVLKMDDDKKLEWLSRRYKEQGKIDQAFEIILSSISPTKDFSSLFEIINHVKDNKKRFDLIKTIDGKISETSDKFRYNAEGTETYCSALAKSVATFDTPEEVLSFLNLNTLNSEVIGSIINKMITFPLNKELISKISEISETLNIDTEKWDAYYPEEGFLDHAYDYVDEEKITSLFGDTERFEVIYELMLLNILPEKVRPYAVRDFDIIQTKSQFEYDLEEGMDDLNFNMEYKKIIRDMCHPILKFMLPNTIPSAVADAFSTRDSYNKIEVCSKPGALDSLANANINLNLLFNRFTNKEGKRLDLEELVSKFNSRKDAISTLMVYVYIMTGDDSRKIDTDNAKEDIYQYIYSSISTGIRSIPYDKFKIMPEDFKIAHPDLFLSDKVPKELEEMLEDFRIVSKLLKYQGYVDILAKEGINLNFIFRNYFGQNQNIELVVKQFASRKDAINALSIYTYLYENYKGINFENESSKEEIYQKIYEAFLRRGCPYLENMPEDFKREHSNLFSISNMSEELKTLIYGKRLNENLLFDHPEWLDILANQKFDLNLLGNPIFNKNGIKVDSNEFVNKFENKKAGLFVLLNYSEINNYYYNINPDETKPEVMVAFAIKYNLHKIHPLFSTPFPFTDLLTDEVLESMLGFKDEQGKQIDVKRVINEFGSREEIAKIWVIYDQMFRNKANGRIDPDNIKESIYQNIHEFIINGREYSEDMPEDFKEKYPDLFLSQDAPEKLRTLFYCTKNDRYNDGTNRYNYAAIYQNPKWLDILAKEDINLNVLFQLYDKERERIDANALAEQFESREDAIRTFATYISIMKATGNIDVFAPKESIYQNIHEFIINGGEYYEDMPEDFKEKYPDLFLSQNVPEGLRTLFYYKKTLYNRNINTTIYPQICHNPKWLDILAKEDINLNVLFQLYDKERERIDANALAEQFESREDAIRTFATYISIMEATGNIDVFAPKESIYQNIHESILKGAGYYEDMPEDFKKEHPDLFLNKDAPEELKTLFYSSNKIKLIRGLLQHPELIGILAEEKINLNLIFKLRDENNSDIDIETIINKFDSRKDALSALIVYSNIKNNNTIPYFENAKEEMYFEIYEGILHGTIYLEDMPEDFKKGHPDLFMSKDAPEKLRELLCNRQLTSTNLLEHPKWLDILAKEDINLNVLFQLYDKEYKQIDANALVEQFESREGAIKYIAIYNQMNCHPSDMRINKESIFREMKQEIEKNQSGFISNILAYPIISDVLSEVNIDLNSIFKLEDENNNYIDAEVAINEFDNRRNAIYAWALYYNITGKEKIPNSKDKLYSKIYEGILLGAKYLEDMPEEFKKEHPDLFLNKDAPEELKTLFYSSNKIELIRGLLQHPELIGILAEEKINLNLIFKLRDENNNDIDIETIINKFDSRKDALSALIVYSNIKNNNTIPHFENAKEEMYFEIYKGILNGAKYLEDMPEDFKKAHPELFLDKTIPKDIRTKFYQKQFTLKDFEENSDLIRTFGNTNLLFGLSDDKYQFLITLFKGPDANNDRLKAIEIFNESTNKEEADFIRESIIESRETIGTIGIEKFPDLIELHKNVQYSNAVELSSFKRNFMREILNSDNPSATFKSLENIYLKGDLPGYMKLFKCFKTIYPKFEKGYRFNFDRGSRISPELLEAGDAEHRFLIVYNDLLRTAVHSQDRTLIEYLNDISEGSELYFALNSREKTIESISNEEVDKLTTFAGHLEALYKSISFPYQEELTENAYKKDELTQKFKILERISAKDYFKDINELVPLAEVEKYKRAMLKTKISLLSKKFNASTIPTPDELKDKIVSYIGHSAGYDSFNQMMQDINRIRNDADKRNRECAEEYRDKPFMFEEGDFVRGIGYIEALTGSLNKGNVAKEFMCSYKGESDSDMTPLDVDITYIVPKSGITTSIDGTPTGWNFGNIFVVIKKDNPNFNITRDKDGNVLDTKYDPNKVEMFGTCTSKGGYFNHWGARTGISFTDVDFILYKENKIIERDEHDLPMVDEKGNIVYVKNSNDRSDGGYVPIEHDALAEIQFEIARNGYYIPVIDMLGRLVFTPEQYDALRSKVAGLPYYSSEEYTTSSKLDFPGINELVEIKKVDMQKTAEKEKIVRGKVEEIIKNSKLDVDTIAIADTLSKDLTEGIVQLIGTGSTSRGTNVPDDSDFDYMLKVDKKVYMHTTDTLIANFKTMEHEEDNSHDKRVRLAGVTVEGLEEPFDIDISIDQKKNNIQYSTEMALEERLKTIRKQSPDDYYKVIANIVYAKQFLKEIGVYKSARVNPELGGLGGVGVENWILQNGGSFRQACDTFLEKAFDPKTGEIVPFNDFKKVYTVWDFGENHESKGKHPFDEYVSLNMNEAGYTKLCVELPKKLKEINEGLSRMSEINSNAPVEIEPEIESKVEIETEEELEPMTASYGFGR